MSNRSLKLLVLKVELQLTKGLNSKKGKLATALIVAIALVSLWTAQKQLEVSPVKDIIVGPYTISATMKNWPLNSGYIKT